MKGLLLCLLFVYTITATGLYEGFKNGYPWHGVDIVVDDERYAAPSLETPGLTSQSIKDTQIFNILGQTLGTPLINDNNDRVALKNVNLFSRPQGHFFFVLEGFTDDMLSNTNFRSLRKTTPSPISRTSRPYFPQATMATAVTGQQPKNHGVFQEGNDLASKNIFDLASHLYEGSAVFGASLSKATAAILAPQSNGATFHWCSTSGWKGKVSQLTQINANDLHQQFPSDDTFLSREDDSIRALVAELSFVLNAGKVLPAQGYSSFFFSFHFQAPQLIAAQFGSSSETFAKAIELIDRVIEVSLQSRPTHSILYLPALNNPQIEEMKNLISPFLVEKIDGKSFFPHCKLNAEAIQDKQQICQELRDALAAASLDKTHIFCALSAGQDKKRSAQSILEEPPGGNGTDPNSVWKFHTFFWVFPLLIAGLLFAIYAIATIEPDVSMEESVAYVKAVPHQKWE